MARDGESRQALTVLVAGDEAPRRTEVRTALLALEEPPLAVVEEGAEGDAEVDVAMVIVGENKEAALARLEAHARRLPRPAVFALLGEPSEPLIRRTLNAGADEVLLLEPPEPQAWMRALLKVDELRRAAQRKGRGAIFSLASLTGGVGLTTLSAYLGLALLRTTGGRIAVVDLDLQQGGLCVALGVKAERTILPLAAVAADKLDPGALEAALTRHPTGLYLLAAPARIEESEQISDATVEAVLEQMERLFDYVVVDCGRHIDGNTAAALERSREVLYVLRQREGAARGALRFMELLGRLRIRREPRLVLNCYGPRDPITEARLAAVVRRPIYACIPRDDQLLERAAALASTPWQVAPRSALVRAYEQLAQRLSRAEQLKAEPDREHAASFVARLLSALGARA